MDEKGKNIKGFKLFIIILIGVILLFSKKENQEKVIDFIKTAKIKNKNLTVIQSIPMEKGIKDIGFYDKELMIWKDKKLIRLKKDGLKEWEKEFNLEELKVSFGNENIYVYEKPTGNIYFLNDLGETIHRVELKTSINNLIESNGYVLVHIKKENMESINILNQEGKIVENNLIKDENILTYSMNKDKEIYAISLLNLKDKNIKSEVEVFKIGGNLLFTTEFNNEIVLYLNFIDNRLIVMTDKSLYCLNDGKILWEKQFQLIKDIYIHKGRINLLFGNTLEIISVDGETEERFSFAEEYKKIVKYDKNLVLYGDEYIIGLKDGKEIFKFKSNDTILKIIEGKKNFIVIYEDRIDIMSL